MTSNEEEEWTPLEAIHREIREVYLTSNRDWIVAYSGGKDSTATLQLIWYALTALPPEQRKRHVSIVSNDTLVDDPAMTVRMRRSCQRINAAAEAEAQACARAHPDYPGPIAPLFSAYILKPELRQRFFYLLIGLGYPSPTARARWCIAPRESTEDQEKEVELPPLFADDSATVVQREAIRHLVEVIANLFQDRDWRGHEERVAEVIARYEAEQERLKSSFTLPTWV